MQGLSFCTTLDARFVIATAMKIALCEKFAADDRDFLGGIDGDAHFVFIDAGDDDADIVADEDVFADFAGEYEHRDMVSFLEVEGLQAAPEARGTLFRETKEPP